MGRTIAKTALAVGLAFTAPACASGHDAAPTSKSPEVATTTTVVEATTTTTTAVNNEVTGAPELSVDTCIALDGIANALQGHSDAGSVTERSKEAQDSFWANDNGRVSMETSADVLGATATADLVTGDPTSPEMHDFTEQAQAAVAQALEHCQATPVEQSAIPTVELP